MYTSGGKLFQLNHGTSGTGAKEFVIPFFHPDEARKIIFIAFLCWCFNWFSFQRYKNTKCSSLKTFFRISLSLSPVPLAHWKVSAAIFEMKNNFSQLNQREKSWKSEEELSSREDPEADFIQNYDFEVNFRVWKMVGDFSRFTSQVKSLEIVAIMEIYDSRVGCSPSYPIRYSQQSITQKSDHRN